MIKRYSIPVFILLLVMHCGFIYTGEETGRVITKLLLIPVLMLYLYVSADLKKPYGLVFAALFFSFLGDLFLSHAGTTWFLLGMVSFMATHVCNSMYFLKLQPFRIANGRPALVALTLFLIATFFVFRLIQPNLGSFQVPILIYMGVIGCMGILATNTLGNPLLTTTAAKFLIPGATFFILSDSMLAMNKFYFHQPATWDVPVMLSYGFAQGLLVLGFARTKVHGS